MEQHLVFRFTHDSAEYNIATASFAFVEGVDHKLAYGDIPFNKKLSLFKEMGLFLWGNESDYQFSDLWLMNGANFENQGAGKYDDFINMAKETTFELYVADVTNSGDSDFDDWQKVGEYHLERARNVGDNFIVISLLSKLVFMEKNTEFKYYSDTLVYETNREQSRPVSLGACFNVPVVLINDNLNVYELNSKITALNIVAAYDDYDPLIEDTDFEQRVLGSIGGYGIDLSSPAAGKITVDVDGGDYDGLLTEHAGIDEGDIDEDSIDDIDTEWAGDYGIFVESPTNIRDLVERLNVAYCGYTYINSNGQIAFNWLKEPAVTPDYSIEKYYISSPGIDIEPDGAPGISDGVASIKNWHDFSTGDLAESVTDHAEIQKATEEYQSYYRSSVTVSGMATFDNFYAHGRNGYFIETFGTNAVKSQDLINHLESLYNVQRKKYTFEIIVNDLLTAMIMNIGETLSITWPRYGLESGKNMLITKIEYSDLLKRKLKITGWA